MCRHLSYVLAEMGYRVLGVDLDPQKNFTLSLFDHDIQAEVDIDNLLDWALEDREFPPASDYVLTTGKLDYISGSKNLSRQESALLMEMGSEHLLKTILEPLRSRYDFIFVDTNRASSPLLINALTASDSVLVPIDPEFFSTEGLSDLITTVLKNKRRLNPNLHFEGIVFSRCKCRTNLFRETRKSVEESLGSDIRVFKTVIPDTVLVGEALSRGKTVVEYVPASPASIAYRALTKELIGDGNPSTCTAAC